MAQQDLTMAGRGGYYGSLHPAYQPFPEHGSLNMSLTRGEASGARRGGLQTPASSSSTSTKLLALLHNQEEKISSLTTEVSLYQIFELLNDNYMQLR